MMGFTNVYFVIKESLEEDTISMKKASLVFFTLIFVVFFVGSSFADTLYGFHNGRALLETKEGYALVNEEKQVLTEKTYDFIDPRFHNGYTTVMRGGLYGMIDQQGKEVLEPTYEKLGQLDEGLIPAKISGKEGFCYVNLLGEVVIETEWNGSAMPFCGGFAVGTSWSEAGSSAYHIIDNNGTIVFSHDNAQNHWIPVNTSAEGFLFRDENAHYLFGENGSIIDIPNTAEYSILITDDDRPFEGGYPRLTVYWEGDDSANYENFLTRDGKLLLPIDKYDRLSRFENGFAWAQQVHTGEDYICDKVDMDGNVIETRTWDWRGPKDINWHDIYQYSYMKKDGTEWNYGTAVDEKAKGEEKVWDVASIWGDEMLLCYEELIQWNTDSYESERLETGYQYYNTSTKTFVYKGVEGMYLPSGFHYPIDGLYPVRDSDGKLAYINGQGELVCGLEYER